MPLYGWATHIRIEADTLEEAKRIRDEHFTGDDWNDTHPAYSIWMGLDEEPEDIEQTPYEDDWDAALAEHERRAYRRMWGSDPPKETTDAA